MAADKEFADRINELREQPVLHARTTIVNAIKKNPQTAAWYLERKRKKEFSERKELTGADGAPLIDAETKKKSRQAVGAFLD